MLRRGPRKAANGKTTSRANGHIVRRGSVTTRLQTDAEVVSVGNSLLRVIPQSAERTPFQ